MRGVSDKVKRGARTDLEPLFSNNQKYLFKIHETARAREWMM